MVRRDKLVALVCHLVSLSGAKFGGIQIINVFRARFGNNNNKWHLPNSVGVGLLLGIALFQIVTVDT